MHMRWNQSVSSIICMRLMSKRKCLFFRKINNNRSMQELIDWIHHKCQKILLTMRTIRQLINANRMALASSSEILDLIILMGLLFCPPIDSYHFVQSFASCLTTQMKSIWCGELLEHLFLHIDQLFSSEILFSFVRSFALSSDRNTMVKLCFFPFSSRRTKHIVFKISSWWRFVCRFLYLLTIAYLTLSEFTMMNSK